MGDATPTLCRWAGGGDAIRRMIDAFYDRVERDDLLSPLLPGGVPERHRDHVERGLRRSGPVQGGARWLREHALPHRGLAITREQRLRFATLMSVAADDTELPDDPELRSALVGYLEWGTRLAMHNSQPGAEVVEQAPVPQWGWGEAPPFDPS